MSTEEEKIGWLINKKKNTTNWVEIIRVKLKVVSLDISLFVRDVSEIHIASHFKFYHFCNRNESFIENADFPHLSLPLLQLAYTILPESTFYTILYHFRMHPFHPLLISWKFGNPSN